MRSPTLDLAGACGMGAIQGLCLPFRGFSRSGATISTGLILGLSRLQVEAFSFALAVLLFRLAGSEIDDLFLFAEFLP